MLHSIQQPKTEVVCMSRKGFTLIELVMVIVIIGILSAVAIPKFISLKTEADRAVCQSNVGAVRTAISNFYAQCNLNSTACPNSVACERSTCFPNASEISNNVSTFAQNYFSEKKFPTVPTGLADWSAAYNNTTGVINITQCCGS
jgi:prepilin-type N-terminal cleavage/methylation domain-containing protein